MGLRQRRQQTDGRALAERVAGVERGSVKLIGMCPKLTLCADQQIGTFRPWIYLCKGVPRGPAPPALPGLFGWKVRQEQSKTSVVGGDSMV